MSYVVDQHLVTTDPFLRGTSAAQLSLFMPLTNGRLFPWFMGGALLLRRTLYPTPGLWHYCGVAVPGESTIAHFDGFTHQPDQAYHYTAVRSLGNGFVSFMAPPVRLDFDAQGDLITPRMPAWPRDVATVPLSGGRFRVSWSYDPIGQGAFPADFQVFEGADAQSVDFDTPLVDSTTALDRVLHVAGRTIYSLTTSAFGSGTNHVFVVRGRNPSGVAEQNTIASAGRKALTTAPTGAAQPRDATVRTGSRRER